MKSTEIRRSFLDYFAERGHRLVKSSPLVLPSDPTLLFANAGMNQFKDSFTGRESRDYRRAATVQKCLRVSGKHNDLETVGRTPRHHTFFEMLGNFSFGDYFKRDAIEMAWQLITGVWGVPEDRLWVTVFGGTDRLAADDEAFAIWRDRIGVAPERILRLGEADNFWRMGETGPCGPCSELHYDLGADLISVTGRSTPETDSRRYMEIWNLVFMEFEQAVGGELLPLPAPSIDTGMGLERISAVLQDKRSNFETDLFRPLVAAIAARSGVEPGATENSDFSMRVIADHARAVCFLVADGVVPSNDKRGYVLRRLLRRAIRHGRKLGMDGPFLDPITAVVIERMAETYPELLAAREAIDEVTRREELRFGETLSSGLVLLDEWLAALPPAETGAARVLPGESLFRLHDTFGFPLDLARDVADERGVVLDEAGFDREMHQQRERARASWKGGKVASEPGVWKSLAAELMTKFVGYSEVELEAVPVLAVLHEGRTVDELIAGQTGEVVLAATPFYAESGGQVADTGWIVGAEGRAEVLDVRRPVAGLIVHRVRVDVGRLVLREPVRAEVDRARRAAVRRNHTATHLLHASLREVVGLHVKQAGSLVAPDRLRFDFSHFRATSDSAVEEVEARVNAQILADLPVETVEMNLDEALDSGAMALFGEKYADRVRVVRVADLSVELCGGTHCQRTGEIGLFKLTAERGVAAGTRRVEALTGGASLARFRSDHAIVRSLEEQLAIPAERIVDEIGQRLKQLREVERQLEAARVSGVRERLLQELGQAGQVGGVKILVQRVDGLSAAETRELADSLRQKLGSGVVVLGRSDGDKASLLVGVTDDLKSRVPAGELVRELARIIGGGGGGRPDLAEAGGRDATRLQEALDAATDVVARRMEATG